MTELTEPVTEVWILDHDKYARTLRSDSFKPFLKRARETTAKNRVLGNIRKTDPETESV